MVDIGICTVKFEEGLTDSVGDVDKWLFEYSETELKDEVIGRSARDVKGILGRNEAFNIIHLVQKQNRSPEQMLPNMGVAAVAK